MQFPSRAYTFEAVKMSERIIRASTILGRRAPLVAQVLKFGAVGGVGLIVNVLVFNGLMIAVFSPAQVPHGTIYATVVATLVAIIVNWIGNRYWAFSNQRQSNTVREGVEFLLVSIAGMSIPLLCVWVSHYVLGFTQLIADNIAINVVGLALGMIFRFALYRWWVFSADRAQAAIEKQHASSTTGVLPGAPDRGLIGDS